MAAPDQAPQGFAVAPSDHLRLDPGVATPASVPGPPADPPLHAIKMPAPRSVLCPVAPPVFPPGSNTLSVDDSRTSDFWEIFFDTPVRVEPFTPDEIADVVAPFAEHRVTFDKGALTELANWTGGVPSLMAWMLHRLWEGTEPATSVSPAAMNQLADAFLREPPSLADALCLDCDLQEQECLARLATKALPAGETPPGVRQSMVDRGLAREQRGELVGTCRIMLQVAQTKGQGADELRRLFGTPAAYASAMPAVLALRLAQIQGVDPRLRVHADHVVRDLATAPELALSDIRALANCSLDPAIAASFPKGEVPREWITQWQHDGLRLDDRVSSGRVPTDRYQQIRLLATCCGTAQTDPVGVPAPEGAVILPQHLHAVGNYGQHLADACNARHIALSACLSALDLCACLADMHTPRCP